MTLLFQGMHHLDAFSIYILIIDAFAWFIGIKESDTGLAAPSQWDLVSDKQMMQEEQPLQAWWFGNYFSPFSNKKQRKVVEVLNIE
jgi:hypothetical protein